MDGFAVNLTSTLVCPVELLLLVLLLLLLLLPLVSSIIVALVMRILPSSFPAVGLCWGLYTMFLKYPLELQYCATECTLSTGVSALPVTILLVVAMAVAIAVAMMSSTRSDVDDRVTPMLFVGDVDDDEGANTMPVVVDECVDD